MITHSITFCSDNRDRWARITKIDTRDLWEVEMWKLEPGSRTSHCHSKTYREVSVIVTDWLENARKP